MKNFTAKILKELQAGRTVSGLKCARWSDCPSIKATSRISDLRAQGHKIFDVWVTSKNGKRFKQYFMKVTK